MFSPNPDGSADLRGHFTPECTAFALAVLDPLAKPKPATPTTRPAAAGRTTTRFTDGDAPRWARRTRAPTPNACTTPCSTRRRLLGSGTLPDCGGVPATVVLTMTLDSWKPASVCHHRPRRIPHHRRRPAPGRGRRDHPRRHGRRRGVLAQGRTCRHATPAQRRALAARDSGCSFPGCDAPPGWSEAHHIIHWEHGGLTDLDNLTLVCGFHHREHQKMGWECQITNGVPNGCHPGGSTPNRTPQHNRAHHIADYLLRRGVRPGLRPGQVSVSSAATWRRSAAGASPGSGRSA